MLNLNAKSIKSYDIGNQYNPNHSILDKKPHDLKKELFFEYNDFKVPATVENLKTIATMIHTLLFLVPGTYPDCPNMGIDIQSIQFEQMTDKVINNLYTKIKDQIKLYLPTIYIQNIIIKKFNNNYIRNTIGIGFEIRSLPSKENTQPEDRFFFVLSQKPDSRKLISKVII